MEGDLKRGCRNVPGDVDTMLVMTLLSFMMPQQADLQKQFNRQGEKLFFRVLFVTMGEVTGNRGYLHKSLDSSWKDSC